MNKRKLKKVVLLAIVILLIVCIILVVVLKRSTNTVDNRDVQSEEERIREYLEEALPPRNIMVLYNYKGELDRNVLYKSMRAFSNYISDLNSELKGDTDEQYEEFYNEHKKEVKTYLGIQEKGKFVDFMNYLKDKNVNVDELKYAEVVKGSSYSKVSYFWFNLNFYYGEEPTCVTFKVGFAEMESALISVKYDIPD